jgi:serine/threonine-protein kinase
MFGFIKALFGRGPKSGVSGWNTPPTSLGRYNMVERIGSGGMGTVYRAIDRDTGRVVAVKILHPHLASIPLYLERFHREASIAGRLDSRYMVRVLDSGSDKGHEYIASEFVDGARLGDVLREGKLEPVQALAIAAQVAQALEEAALHGVIHRDIKPDNIIFTQQGNIKVADFGISRLSDATTVTVTGMFVGTLAYIAPEQARGQADIRSDIYSLGITVFEMLTGELPFHSETPTGLMRMHEEAPPPLERLEGLPPSVVALVARCLEKDPDKRYQHPSELRADIESARRIVAPPLSDTWIATVTSTLAETRIGVMPLTVMAGSPTPASASGGGSPPKSRFARLASFGGGRLPIAALIAVAVLLLAGIGGAMALTGGGSDDDGGGPDVRRTETPTPITHIDDFGTPAPVPSGEAPSGQPDQPGGGDPPSGGNAPTGGSQPGGGTQPGGGGPQTTPAPVTPAPVTPAPPTGAPAPPTPTPEPPSVTPGNWTSDYIVGSNNCPFGPTPGSGSQKAWIFKERSPANGKIHQGEVFEIWEGSTNWGTKALGWPSLAWNLPVSRVVGGTTYNGTMTLQIDFTSFNNGYTYAWEQYPSAGNCVIYHQDPSGRPPSQL